MLKIFIRTIVAVILCLSIALFVALPVAESGGEHETLPPDIPAVSDPGEIVDASKAEYGYYEMSDDLAALAVQNEGRFTYTAVGESLDGRNIYAATLGNPNAEKQIVVSAGIHAREYMTPLLVMKQIEYYLDNYETGEYDGVKYSEIFEKYAFCILPMCNPDGIALAQEGIDGIRDEKLRETVISVYNSDRASTPDFAELSLNDYLKYWKSNARGVDLNRNFDTPAWNDNLIRRPCFTDCRGEFPLSEPESRAMADYVSGLPNPVLSLAIHSRGELVYFNCGQENTLREYELARLVSDANGYGIDHNSRNVAAFDDWCVMKKDIPSVTVETGITACPLPIEEFEKIWNDNRDLWAAVAVKGEY